MLFFMRCEEGSSDAVKSSIGKNLFSIRFCSFLSEHFQNQILKEQLNTERKAGLRKGNSLFPSRSVFSGYFIRYNFFWSVAAMTIVKIIGILVIGFCVFIIVFHAAPSFQKQYAQNCEIYNKVHIELSGKVTFHGHTSLLRQK